MSSLEKLLKAKTLLGLSDKETLSQIKLRYKNLMQKWHPDRNPDDTTTAQQMSAKINEAYKIILEYCKNYEFSFKEEDIKEKSATPHEWWEARFGDPNRPKR